MFLSLIVCVLFVMFSYLSTLTLFSLPCRAADNDAIPHAAPLIIKLMFYLYCETIGFTILACGCDINRSYCGSCKVGSLGHGVVCTCNEDITCIALIYMFIF